jgi:hypothetical protein
MTGKLNMASIMMSIVWPVTILLVVYLIGRFFLLGPIEGTKYPSPLEQELIILTIAVIFLVICLHMSVI